MRVPGLMLLLLPLLLLGLSLLACMHECHVVTLTLWCRTNSGYCLHKHDLCGRLQLRGP